MGRYLSLSAALLSLCILASSCSGSAPEPVGPTPSENQMRWQEMEYYAFIHFSLNTYTDQSWGYGDEALSLFNPEQLDARQWARICKEAGMTGIIFTAKHHCGFCMWPSEYTEYSVKNTPWKDGKGDVVKELADACKEYGLKFGVYLSPWDRNSAVYGQPEYVTYFRNQMRELLTNYGPVFETWFDGANGGNGYYGGANETRRIDAKTYYEWPETFRMIRELQPEIVIWNDGGDRGDLRWVGTEAGYVGETNWSLLNHDGDVPFEMLHYGLEDGDSWVCAEVNTSIRPEWFYHPSEDMKVKTVPKLMETYYQSVGRNATLLLNVPIMPNGLIHPTDEQRLKEFAQARAEAFAVNLAADAKASADNVRGRKYNARKAVDGKKETYWATEDGCTSASLTIDLGSPRTVNRILAQEYIRLGQRVKSFEVAVDRDGSWETVAEGTTIGYKRILLFKTVETSKVRLTIKDAKACPLISNVELYHAPQLLEAPQIIRSKDGSLSFKAVDDESEIHYTLDGSEPGVSSPLFSAPVASDGKVSVKAVAFDRYTGKSSPVSTESFDVPRAKWSVVGITPPPALPGGRMMRQPSPDVLFDGDPSTAYHQGRGPGAKLPCDLVVDMGETLNLAGFKYTPDPGAWGPGIITFYRFDVSQDGKRWNTVSQGEFSNIKNNPVEQVVTFPASQARFIRLTALANTENNANIGYAEINVITE